MVVTPCAVRPRPSDTATPMVFSPTSRPIIRIYSLPERMIPHTSHSPRSPAMT